MTSFIIEQSVEQARLAFELHTHAEIHFIRLKKARLSTGLVLESAAGPIVLRFRHKARHVQAPEGLLRLEIEFRLTGERERAAPEKSSRTGKQPLVLIDSTWEVSYQLANGYQPVPRTVTAFKDGNAIFNCWPYFREFLQSTVSRMNLPPLTLPLLRLSPKLSPKKKMAGMRPEAAKKTSGK